MTTEGNAGSPHDADLLRMDDEGPLPQPRPAEEEGPATRDDLGPQLAAGK